MCRFCILDGLKIDFQRTEVVYRRDEREKYMFFFIIKHEVCCFWEFGSLAWVWLRCSKFLWVCWHEYILCFQLFVLLYILVRFKSHLVRESGPLFEDDFPWHVPHVNVTY